MREALENIFKPQVTVTSFVTVIERLSPTRYEVTDIAGRTQTAETGEDEFYPPGVRVVVQNGRIIGLGHRAGNHRIYEV